jgi:hypothetical protein
VTSVPPPKLSGLEVATPFEDEPLPGGQQLSAHALTLPADTRPQELVPDGFDVVYLVAEGTMELGLANGLHGSIAAGTYVHLREGMRHELRATS